MALSSKNLDRKLPRTSFRLYVLTDERDRFKRLCRSRGSTMYRVLSNFIRACLTKEDSMLEPSGVVIQNVFTGRPRGRRRIGLKLKR